MHRENERQRYDAALVIVVSYLVTILFAACGGLSVDRASTDTTVEQGIVTSTATDAATDAIASATSTTVLATSTSTATLVEESDTTARAIVTAASLNVRTGPGVAYSRIGFVVRDDELEVLGRYNNCQWLQITAPSGQVGWVSAGYVTYSWECDSVAEVEAPPPPRKTSTPTPDFVSAATLSPTPLPTLVSADTPTWTPAPTSLPTLESADTPTWTPAPTPLPTLESADTPTWTPTPAAGTPPPVILPTLFPRPTTLFPIPTLPAP